MSVRRSIAVSSLAAIAVTFVTAFGVLDALELPLRDAVLRRLRTRPALATVVVAIDEQSLRVHGAWPWPRSEVAKLVDHAVESGARSIVLDIVLAEKRDGDDLLARATQRVPSVAVAALDEHGDWLLPNDTLRSAVVAAHGNFELDGDGILRRIAATKQSRGTSLAALAVYAASTVDARPVSAGSVIAPGFRTPARMIPRVSATDLLAAPRSRQLRGRVVFIGPTALALGDRVLTPTATRLPDPGVTVHAAATESILAHDVLHPVAPLLCGFIAGLLVLVLTRGDESRRRRLARAVYATLVTVGLAVALLDIGRVASPLLTFIFLIFATTAIVEFHEAALARRRSSSAAARMESGLGLPPLASDEVAPRLDAIAEMMVTRRSEDADAKRMLAHELKTPLASMRGLTQLLNRFELSDQERQRVAVLLEQEAGKLQLMVDSLLELERLSARKFDEGAYLLDLSQLVEARVRFLQASTERGLHSSVEAGIAVDGDAVLLERVIDNLIGNALKYSAEPLTVVIRLRREHSSAVLEVEDRGAGIPAEEREKIFNRFVRGSTARGTEGLGLGLPMVAEIIRWHRGRVEMVPASEGGSLFRVTLPAARNH